MQEGHFWEKLLVAMILALCVSFVTPTRASALGGALVYEVGLGTAASQAVLVSAAAGSLYDIEITSGAAAGDYVSCYDSATISGITISVDGVLVGAAKKVAELVVAATNTTTNLPAGHVPRAYQNGLVCVGSAAARRFRALYAN